MQHYHAWHYIHTLIYSIFVLCFNFNYPPNNDHLWTMTTSYVHFIRLTVLLCSTFYHWLNSVIDNYHLKISLSVEFQHFTVFVQISFAEFQNIPNLLNSIFEHLNYFLSVGIQFSVNLFKSKIPKSLLFRQPVI